MLPPAPTARRFVLRGTTATLSLVACVAASLPHRPYPAFVPLGASPYGLAAPHHSGKKEHQHHHHQQQQQYAFSTFARSGTSSRRPPVPGRRAPVRAAAAADDEVSAAAAPSFSPITIDATTRTAWPDLRPAQWKQIEALANLLVEVNTKINVISRKDIQVGRCVIRGCYGEWL